MSQNYMTEFLVRIFLDIDFSLIKENQKENLIKWQYSKQLHQVYCTCREFNNDIINAQMVRPNQNLEKFLTGQTAQIYRNFACDLLQMVYKRKYELKLEKIMDMEIISEVKKKDSKLHTDLFYDRNMRAICSMADMIDKVASSELSFYSCFGFCDATFESPFNSKLSPLALAISFFYSREKRKKKDPQTEAKLEIEESCQTKLTYILFGGCYSEIDIDVIYSNSDQVQVIMIYDDSAGGPSFNELMTTNYGKEKRFVDNKSQIPLQQRLPFDKMSKKNLILLPVNGSVNSNFLKHLFENFVMLAINKYKPDLVLISNFFMFRLHTLSKRNSFTMKINTWMKILSNICLLVQYRVIIFPLKSNFDDVHDISSSSSSSSSSDQNIVEFENTENSKFSSSLDFDHMENCFLGSLDILARRKVYPAIPRKKLISISKFNPQTQYWIKVLSYYGDRQEYSFLAVENQNDQFKINNLRLKDYITHTESQIYENPCFGCLNAHENFSGGKTHTYNSVKYEDQDDRGRQVTINKYMEINSSYIDNRMYFFNISSISNKELSQSFLTESYLMFDKPPNYPFFPRKESQYIVDYPNNKLYYFNVLYDNKYMHFEFPLDLTQNQLKTSKESCQQLNTHPLQKHDETLFNLGLCIGNNCVFWVYGAIKSSHSATNTIYYFNSKEKTWYEPKIVNNNFFYTILPRHSVTCNYFTINGKQVLYVFGGTSDTFDSTKKWRIFNIIEYYEMDFTKQAFTLNILKKETLFRNKISYVPYRNSILWGMEESTKQVEEASQNPIKYFRILVLGGHKYSYSTSELNYGIKTFTLNHNSQWFEEIIQNSKTPNPKLLLSDSSCNVLNFKDSLYILARHSKNNYLIAKVSGTPQEPNIETQEFYPVRNPIIKVGKERRVLEQPSKPASSVIEFRKLMSIFAGIPDKARCLLYYITKYIGTKSPVNSQHVEELMSNLVNDALFKKEFDELNVKHLYVLFPNSFRDKRFKTITVDKNTKFEELKKAILEDKPKNELINNMMLHIDYNQRSVFIVQRIWRKCNYLNDYHEPTIVGLYIRWFSRDIGQILSKGNRQQLIEKLKQEDIGILRDLIDCLGKLLIDSKNRGKNGINNTLNMQTYLCQPIDKLKFWTDPDKDNLSRGEQQEEERKEESQKTIILPFNVLVQKDIYDTLIILLKELLIREEVNCNDIINKNYSNKTSLNDKEKKWLHIMQSYEDFAKDLQVSNENLCKLEQNYKDLSVETNFKNSDSDKSSDNGGQIPPKTEIKITKPQNPEITTNQITLKNTEQTIGKSSNLENQKPPTVTYPSEETKINITRPQNSKTIHDKTTHDKTTLPTKKPTTNQEELKSSSNQNLKPPKPQNNNTVQESKEKIKITKPGPQQKITEETKSSSQVNTNSKPESKKENCILFPGPMRDSETTQESYTKINKRLAITKKITITMKENKELYHSLDNLDDAHHSTDLDGFLFFLGLSGGQLVMLVPPETWLSAKLILYDPVLKEMNSLYITEEHASSVCIWHSAIYFYLDETLSKKFLGENLTNCVFYADLRETFSTQKLKTPFILLYPIFKTYSDLSNRCIIADHEGIYIFGGSKPQWQKNLLVFKNECHYYELEQIEDMESVTKIQSGGIMTMSLYRDNLIATQTESKIYVTSKTNQNEDFVCIEILDKECLGWMPYIKLPCVAKTLSVYKLITVNFTEQNEKVALISNYSSHIILDGKDDSLKKWQPLYSEDKKELISTGYERFNFQNCYKADFQYIGITFDQMRLSFEKQM